MSGLLKLNALEVAKRQDLKHPKHQKDVLDDVLRTKKETSKPLEQ